MGNKCCAESKLDIATEKGGEVVDLPAVDVSGVRD